MALTDQPYLKLYVQDFLTCEKLGECSAEATGVFARLMCLLHKSEKYGAILLKQKHKQSTNHLLNFARSIARFMPWPEEVVARGLSELIEEGVITLEGDELLQKRMVKDGQISQKRAENGSEGGRATQAKNKAGASDFAKAKRQAKNEQNREYEYESEPDNVNKKEKGVPGEKETAELWPTFLDFWEAYSYKVDRSDAERAWNKLSQKDRLAVMQALPEYVKTTHTNGNFPSRKHASTYLNKKSWTNEPYQLAPEGRIAGPGTNSKTREAAAITELIERRSPSFNFEGNPGQS